MKIELKSEVAGRAKEAYDKIVSILESEGCEGSGLIVYSGEDWTARGERYGEDALIVIIHEEGDDCHYFSMDACYNTGRGYDGYETMFAALRESDLMNEQINSWSSAVHDLY